MTRRPNLPGGRWPLLVAGFLATVAVAGVATLGVLFLTGRSEGAAGYGLAPAGDAPADFHYVIPSGSGTALDQGDPIEVLPESLDATTGQVIEIVNQDNRGYLVGPFFVGAEETVRYRFSTPGSYAGVCSVHPSGQIVITVR